MSNLKDYLGGLDPAVWTDAKADHLDADVSTRAPASTALVNTTWTDARATKLDTVLTNVTWTDARAAQLDLIAPTDVSNLDVAVSTRAPAATALSTTDWTTARAGKLDNVDASISSRAPSSSALSTSTWTNARAAKLDLISSSASLSTCSVQRLKTRQRASGTVNNAEFNWAITSSDMNQSFLSINSSLSAGQGGEDMQSAYFSSNTSVKYTVARYNTTPAVLTPSWEKIPSHYYGLDCVRIY